MNKRTFTRDELTDFAATFLTGTASKDATQKEGYEKLGLLSHFISSAFLATNNVGKESKE